MERKREFVVISQLLEGLFEHLYRLQSQQHGEKHVSGLAQDTRAYYRHNNNNVTYMRV